MAHKFLSLVENSISRFSNGGFLVGDSVKFVDGFKSKESFKCMNSDMQKYVTDFAKTDKTIKIVDIKTYYPSSAPGDNANRGGCFNVELATEFAPGSYDLQNKVTVSSDLLVANNTYPNLTDISPSIRKKEKRTMKPTKPEEDEETPNGPYDQTMMSQSGEKLVRGDRALLNKNVKIPSVNAKGSNTVGNYTQMYMGKS